jgi:hypothetical protein
MFSAANGEKLSAVSNNRRKTKASTVHSSITKTLMD